MIFHKLYENTREIGQLIILRSSNAVDKALQYLIFHLLLFFSEIRLNLHSLFWEII